MNNFSFLLAGVGTCASVGSVYLFSRAGYVPLRKWIMSRAENDAARYRTWVDELSLGWDAAKARNVALAARIGVVASSAVVFVFSRSAVFTASIAVVVYWVPMWIYRVARDRRINKLEEQIPDAIDVMVACVRAGSALATAVEEVHHRMPTPISHEFGIIATEHRVGGLSIEDALERARTRISVESFTMLASALIINARQGGELMHILERISEATRELYRLQKKINTETSEVRAQEKVIMFMTPLFLIMVCFFDPSIPDILFHSVAGNILLVIVGVIQVIGFAWIRRIVRTTV